MDEKEYLSLFEKHLAGQTSPAEEQLLKDHKDEFKLLALPWDTATMGEQEIVKDKLFKSLQAETEPKQTRRIRLRYWSAAAAILLVCSLTWYFNDRLGAETGNKDRVAHRQFQDIRPGGNKAVLTLSDGSEVILDSAINSPAIQDGNATISRKDNGLLVYNAGQSISALTEHMQINRISTPRGGQYQVVLQDGTKVWLNASSSISFPTYFSGKDRVVQLSGEAYFEVSKNAYKPFKVQVNGMEVKVLGTHFNIMAYADEANTQTTLLEGSVEISTKTQRTLLKPGQQAAVENLSNAISVQAVNTSGSVAWKNGNFMFTDDDIYTIMRRLSRWYDVDVVYQGNLSDQVFAGYVSRYENINEVLKTLELTGTIHFKIEGRRITVMP